MTQDDAQAAGVGWIRRPMYCLPADDAPLTEWLRPVSSLLITRRSSFFSNDDRSADHGAQGVMAQRMNKTRRKRAAKINMPKFWRLRAQGVGVAKMATALGVSARTIERALTMRPRDG